MQLACDVAGHRNWPTITSSCEPLSDAAFSVLMKAVAPFEHSPRIAVAVSGGPDSLALMLLASRWATSHGGQAVGLTVDHGLRMDSAAEARQTGQWLKQRGIEHHILTWKGPKPTSGLQQQARNARYERLFAWCRKAGVLHLLTGHHRQDQAETIALRQARQSGSKGLSGMAAIREVQGLRLLRPLLDTSKERLRATLRHAGQVWIDDPSNQSLRFARNRLRHDGIDLSRLADLPVHYGLKRQNADRELHAALIRRVGMDPAGFALASQDFLEGLTPDLAQALVAGILMTVGGDVYPPRGSGLKRLLAMMRRHRPFAGATLGHCRIVEHGSQWLFCREMTKTSAMVLVPERWCVWQHRFLMRSRHRTENGSISVRELGERGWTRRDQLIAHRQSRYIPPKARPSLPSIWQGDTLLSIPHAGLFRRYINPLNIDIRFRPLTPLANAPFAAHMCASSVEKTVAVAR